MPTLGYRLAAVKKLLGYRLAAVKKLLGYRLAAVREKRERVRMAYSATASPQ